MSVKIGSGFSRELENGQKLISVAIDPAVLPLTLDENKKLTLWFAPKEDRKSDKSPQWRVSVDKFTPDGEANKPNEATEDDIS